MSISSETIAAILLLIGNVFTATAAGWVALRKNREDMARQEKKDEIDATEKLASLAMSLLEPYESRVDTLSATCEEIKKQNRDLLLQNEELGEINKALVAGIRILTKQMRELEISQEWRMPSHVKRWLDDQK